MILSQEYQIRFDEICQKEPDHRKRYPLWIALEQEFKITPEYLLLNPPNREDPDNNYRRLGWVKTPEPYYSQMNLLVKRLGNSEMTFVDFGNEIYFILERAENEKLSD